MFLLQTKLVHFWKTLFFRPYWHICQVKHDWAPGKKKRITSKKMVKNAKKQYMVFLLDKTSKAYKVSVFCDDIQEILKIV